MDSTTPGKVLTGLLILSGVGLAIAYRKEKGFWIGVLALAVVTTTIKTSASPVPSI